MGYDQTMKLTWESGAKSDAKKGTLVHAKSLVVAHVTGEEKYDKKDLNTPLKIGLPHRILKTDT